MEREHLSRARTSSRVSRSFFCVVVNLCLPVIQKARLVRHEPFPSGPAGRKKKNGHAECTFSAWPYKEAKRLNSGKLQPVEVSTTPTSPFQRYS